MMGLQGAELTQDEHRILKDYPFGGVILFRQNLIEPKQIQALCRSLWEKCPALPPFIAVDHEGGRVHHLPAPFTHFPSAALIGKTESPEIAYAVGLASARELSSLGINLNFAPVLDVNSNPRNPVIGDRALSSDPAEAAKLGWCMVQGLRAGGIIPCCKHFPGHGDTSADSHRELPVVRKKLSALQIMELHPFIEACRNGIDALMTGHVLYPALDKKYPATLSHSIITRLLRRQLKYEGVVFGDDLEMKALTDNYDLEEIPLLALNAGVDVLMFCRLAKRAIQAFDVLLKEGETDERTSRTIAESFGRLERLKKSRLKEFPAIDPNKLLDLRPHSSLVSEIKKHSGQET
ncbi:MAG: beta-N-acetylhexosaminidase [Deltaproteobacteria bacterium]|nr:beta-N-acetylhexosaminidase [Deltaproteobacteria bacterium]